MSSTPAVSQQDGVHCNAFTNDNIFFKIIRLHNMLGMVAHFISLSQLKRSAIIYFDDH